MTAIADGTAGTEVPRLTALERAAVEALATQAYEPLAVGELLREAWAGATAALVQAGGSFAPPPPDYPSDPVAAYELHDDTFPTLERLADGQVSLDGFTTAALEELLTRRRDARSLLGPRVRSDQLCGVGESHV